MMMMMANDNSFDVVSEFDAQELTNALDQTRRDVNNRFDLKDSNTEITQEKDSITITSSDEMKVRNVIAILEEKLAKRGLSPFLLNLAESEPEAALGSRCRQEIPLKTGIDKELAKDVVKAIKETKLKVQATIQGEQVRVSGKSRDDLQQVMSVLRQKMAEWEVPLQFNNFR
jgi:uncharacterized protein YajQ (UPF0234 family)